MAEELQKEQDSSSMLERMKNNMASTVKGQESRCVVMMMMMVREKRCWC